MYNYIYIYICIYICIYELMDRWTDGILQYICEFIQFTSEHFSNQTTKLIERSHTNVLKHSKINCNNKNK